VKFRLVLVLAAALAVGGRAADAQDVLPPASVTISPSDEIKSDPLIRRGMLPNGVRYAVRSSALPKGALSVRLAIDVGSYVETDAERGAAHFIEHMAFNGTKNFPEGELERTFARIGVGFGRDQNAGTTMFTTSYSLDLPQADGPATDLAFRWLRDVADGVIFAPAAVDRERRVVLAEREANLSASEATGQAMMAFELKGARSIDRDPIGLLSTLNAMTPSVLQAFYERWYRPENAVVIAVGDMSADELERRVREGFSAWNAAGPATPRPAYGLSDVTRPRDVLVLTDTAITPRVQLCRVRTPYPVEPLTIARLRRESIGRISRSILDRRLRRMAAADDPPFIAAATSFMGETRDAASTCVIGAPTNGDFDRALAALDTEARRFIAYGPTPQELDTAVEELRSAYRGAAGTSATRESSLVASLMMADELNEGVSPNALESFRAYDRAVLGLTPDEVRDGFRRDWSGAGPLVTAVGPRPPTKDALAAAWEAARTTGELARPTDAPQVRWAYADFGEGQIERRQHVREGDFERITFRNGVVLNIKQTAYAQQVVQIAVSFGGGRREFADDDYFQAVIGSAMFRQGGLTRHSIEDIDGIFSRAAWGANLMLGDNAYHLYATTSAPGLAMQMSILAAYLSEPGFRRSMDAALPATIDALYRSYENDPKAVLAQALAKAVSPRGTTGIPPLEAMSRFRSTDIERMLKPAITSAPLEVTLVGDIDERLVIEIIRFTLGALPERSRAKVEASDQTFLRFPMASPGVIRATHKGSSEQAIAGVVWPLYVADPARRREEFTLTIINDLLGQRLLKRVREELGKSYAPETTNPMPDFADQGYLMALVEASPADVDEAVAETVKVGKALAAGQFTAEDLEAVRAPLLSGLAARARTNDWWLSALDGSAKNPQGIEDNLNMERIIASVTLAEVKQVAAKWLSQDPIVVIAAPEPQRAALGTTN